VLADKTHLLLTAQESTFNMPLFEARDRGSVNYRSDQLAELSSSTRKIDTGAMPWNHSGVCEQIFRQCSGVPYQPLTVIGCQQLSQVLVDELPSCAAQACRGHFVLVSAGVARM
jgi:hypothetical protein